MIAMVRGKLVYKSIDHIIVDVGGIGYRLFVPLSTFYALPDDGQVNLHTHTHVREDAFLLYGFLTMEEKELFSTLISITGVGPKLAVNILSHIPADELKLAISREDIKRLSSLPGIGKKTAERLVLELKDRVGQQTDSLPTGKHISSSQQSHQLDDVVSALVNLGYKEHLARKILGSMELSEEASTEQILKGALKILVR
ncbi:MAG: Holliday junction branch migration protein RuvA [Deltaproteobacteria bacterium]|jgi:Holliday junction DNA helicase RuvA|nr:Holliday junction branch migration protein RuvA [Deltaproteobacteria bacterium]MBW2477073.1 Holliday junction branch migration protein RuvA [Deltaproteobacteria bacterium]MBW2503166.1 Holliday junction branch migration protein RuvA [Deltaproteobacteria bacterium]MBW2519740.1 Holliday junction branch migration protein RuvA [Deltaproteobacteria bacterium]